MFNEDVKRIYVCIEYEDYYSAMEYSNLVKEKYNDEEKQFFENIIKNVKNAEYNLLKTKLEFIKTTYL